MKKILLSTVVATTLLIANNTKYEITPIFGHVDTKEHKTFENHNAAGVSLGFKRGEDCKFDITEVGVLHTNKTQYVGGIKNTKVTRVFVNQIKEFEVASKLKLFALVGLGYERSDRVNTKLDENDPYFNYGAGIKYSINDTFALRSDVRHMLRFDGMKHVMYTAGLAISFGDKKSDMDFDTDNDGVLNKYDNCPTTKANVKVDGTGCAIPLDSDNDGVVDAKDKCLATPAGTTVDLNGCKISDNNEIMNPENLNINFATNSDLINSADLSKFDKYVKYLNQVPTSRVAIEAHTDATGPADYNKHLSVKRANSAKKVLVDMGIDANRIDAIGYGEEQPLIDNKTSQNRANNRRVTARIIK